MMMMNNLAELFWSEMEIHLAPLRVKRQLRQCRDGEEPSQLSFEIVERSLHGRQREFGMIRAEQPPVTCRVVHNARIEASRFEYEYATDGVQSDQCALYSIAHETARGVSRLHSSDDTVPNDSKQLYYRFLPSNPPHGVLEYGTVVYRTIAVVEKQSKEWETDPTVLVDLNERAKRDRLCLETAAEATARVYGSLGFVGRCRLAAVTLAVRPLKALTNEMIEAPTVLAKMMQLVRCNPYEENESFDEFVECCEALMAHIDEWVHTKAFAVAKAHFGAAQANETKKRKVGETLTANESADDTE